MQMKRRVFVCGFCSLFLSLTVFFFAPLEVMLLNSRDFCIPFSGIWLFQLGVALGIASVLTLILVLLPRRVSGFMLSLMLGTGVAIWIQIMFLNGNMVVMTGDDMQVSSTQTVANAAIWAVIIAGVCVAFHVLQKKKPGLAEKGAGTTAAALTVMQAVAFVSLVLTPGLSTTRSFHVFSPEGEFEISSGVNVVEFVVDMADGTYVREMLDKYPEMSESLSGWVWYPDTTSRYSRTYPSLAYMLSGEDCRVDRLPEESADEAFAVSPYLRELHEAGTDIRIFTGDSLEIGLSADQWIENSRDIFGGLGEMDLYQFEKHILHISLYKCAPYILKNLFTYDITVINVTSFRNRPFQMLPDPVFYQNLSRDGAFSVSDRYQKAYRFYHMWGVHPGASWDDQLVEDNEQNRAAMLRGSFRIIELYIEKMKHAGVYDDSLIIVTADHGISKGEGEGLRRSRAACPLLMIKYPHADNSRSLETDPTMTAHDDLFRAVQDVLVGSGASPVGSGKAPKDFAGVQERTRLHYYTALDQRNREDSLVEYEIRGNAECFENWKETGNTREIKYSTNPVSDHTDRNK